MSAAPLPKPDEGPTAGPEGIQVDEGWALLEGLRRRLDDQASQSRKTQQQVTQLTESIAALVADHRQRTRRINLNSFVAYVIYTVLLGVGFYILYNSRANELVEARDHAIKERDAATARADDLAARTTARDLADTKAWEVYQLLEAGKRSEATAKLDALRDLRLSRTERAILAARAHETQVMEVDNAIKAATASFKAGRHQEAIAPLEAALVGEPNGSRRATMRYFLGIAYAKTGALEKAISYLQTAVDADVEHDDARFQLASALDRAGHYAKARAEYDKFATAHPQSQFAVYAMRRSALLAKLPPDAKPEPAPAPGAGSGSAAPKPGVGSGGAGVGSGSAIPRPPAQGSAAPKPVVAPPPGGGSAAPRPPVAPPGGGSGSASPSKPPIAEPSP